MNKSIIEAIRCHQVKPHEVIEEIKSVEENEVYSKALFHFWGVTNSITTDLLKSIKATKNEKIIKLYDNVKKSVDELYRELKKAENK